MNNIDKIGKNVDVDSNDGITIFECLYICNGCEAFFQKIKTEQEKKYTSKRKKEIEILINEVSDLGKCSGGEK